MLGNMTKILNMKRIVILSSYIVAGIVPFIVHRNLFPDAELSIYMILFWFMCAIYGIGWGVLVDWFLDWYD